MTIRNTCLILERRPSRAGIAFGAARLSARLSAVDCPPLLKFLAADKLVTPAVLTVSTVTRTMSPATGKRGRAAMRKPTAMKTIAKAVKHCPQDPIGAVPL